MERPLVLGVETSCDDTACAVLDGDGRVLASVVSSQLAHQAYGGVVPEIASREHLVNWPAVSAEALARAGVKLAEIDLVAATRGPGLVGSLLVGLSLGKAIAWSLGRPFHAVHHLEGHLYSPFLSAPGPEASPAAAVPEHFTALVVSGGHTSLFEVEDGRVETLAETRDDAFGEAFDKIGKRLGLPYPQGPLVDRWAELGDAVRSAIAKPQWALGLDFSYSGLKSQALLAIENLERTGLSTQAREGVEPPFSREVLDLLAGFRAAAVGQILDKLTRLTRQRPVEVLAVSGGAAANRLLRRRLAEWSAEHAVDLRLVPLIYSGDNAAMIAHAALLAERRGQSAHAYDADAASRLPLGATSAQRGGA